MSDQPKTWIEEVEVAANQVIDRVKELAQEGNVRHLIIRKPDGSVLVEIPLNAGIGIGTLMVLFAPYLTAIAALGGLIAKLKLEIVREGDPTPEPSKPEKTKKSNKNKVQINLDEDSSSE